MSKKPRAATSSQSDARPSRSDPRSDWKGPRRQVLIRMPAAVRASILRAANIAEMSMQDAILHAAAAAAEATIVAHKTGQRSPLCLPSQDRLPLERGK